MGWATAQKTPAAGFLWLQSSVPQASRVLKHQITFFSPPYELHKTNKQQSALEPQEEQRNGVFLRQGLCASSGNGSSYTKPAKRLGGPGAVLTPLIGTLSGCNGLFFPKQLGNSYNYSVCFVQEETRVQRG